VWQGPPPPPPPPPPPHCLYFTSTRPRGGTFEVHIHDFKGFFRPERQRRTGTAWRLLLFSNSSFRLCQSAVVMQPPQASMWAGCAALPSARRIPTIWGMNYRGPSSSILTLPAPGRRPALTNTNDSGAARRSVFRTCQDSLQGGGGISTT